MIHRVCLIPAKGQRRDERDDNRDNTTQTGVPHVGDAEERIYIRVVDWNHLSRIDHGRVCHLERVGTLLDGCLLRDELHGATRDGPLILQTDPAHQDHAHDSTSESALEKQTH